MTQKLIDAALAVVTRWESPDWAKVVREGGGPHTGELIHDLRKAVETANAGLISERGMLIERIQNLTEALENAGDMNDGEFRHCCMTRLNKDHAEWCAIGQALCQSKV